MRILAVLLLAIVLAGTGPMTGAAQSEPKASPEAGGDLPSFAIYFKDAGPREVYRVSQKAGTTANYTVVIANPGTGGQPFDGLTFAPNVTIRTNGGVQTGDPDEEPTGATAWLDYAPTPYTLEDGQGTEITFPVSVPADAKPGQYIIALAFQTAEPLEIAQTPELRQTLRATTVMVLTVPGTIEPSFKVSDLHLVIDQTWSGFVATIENTGNILVRPRGKLTISDADGNPMMTQDFGLGSFFAFMSGTMEVGFANTLPPGDYLVTVEMRDEETGATAIVENVPISTMSQGELQALSLPPVTINDAAAVPRPDDAHPQFLDVDVLLGNTGEPVENAELNIAAYRDGELIENFVLLSPLSLPTGETPVHSRYIPADGFAAGSWTFTISVQVRDTSTGVATVLATVSTPAPLVIGS
jgi:hypothetical protein